MRTPFAILIVLFAAVSTWAENSKDHCQTYVLLDTANQDEAAWYFGKGIKKYPRVCPSDQSHAPEYIIKLSPEYHTTQTSVPVTTGSSRTTVDLHGTEHSTGTINTTTQGRETRTTTGIKGYAYVYSAIKDATTGEIKPSGNPVFATSHQLGGFSVSSDVRALEDAVKFVDAKTQKK